jgi:hypothetical protein
VRRWMAGGLLLMMVLVLAGCAEPAAVDPVDAAPALRPAVPLAVSPSGARAAYGAPGGGLMLVDESGTERRLLDGEVLTLAWAQTSDRLLVGFVGGKAAVVEPATGKIIDLSGRFDDGWLLAAWAPDGSQVVVTANWIAATADVAPVLLADVSSGAVREVTKTGRVVGLHWLDGGQALLEQAAGTRGSQGARLDLATGALTDLGFRTSWAVSPDGRSLAESNGPALTIQHLDTGEQRLSDREFGWADPRPEMPFFVYVRGWSPDSRYLALTTTNPAGTLRVMNGREWEPELVAPDWTGAFAWLGQGRDVAYATRTDKDGLTVHRNGAVVGTHPDGIQLGLSDRAPAAVLSPDGRRLAYTVVYPGNRSEVIVADLATGETRALPNSSGLQPLYWSQENDRLIAARLTYESDAHGEAWKLAGTQVLDPGVVTATPVAKHSPLWAPPGTTVWTAPESGSTEEPRVLSRGLAPFTYKGRTFHPTVAGSETLFFRQEGADVWLDGRLTHAGTLQVFDEPRYLFRLPLTLGTTFALHWEHHNFGSGPEYYTVTGFEPVEISSGRQMAVRIQSQRSGDEGVWVPGLGPVASGAQVETGVPLPVPAAKHVDGKTLYLVGTVAVHDQDGRVLWEAQAHPLRSQADWVDLGEGARAVLWYSHTPSEPHQVHYGAVYLPGEGKFVPLRWRLPDGREKTRVAGWLKPFEGGGLSLQDEEHYPYMAECIFKWVGDHVACSVYRGEGKLRTNEETFARLLTLPLDEEAWATIFLDPEQGRAAYRATRREDGWNRLAYANLTPLGEGTWQVGDIRITLVRHGEDWRVASWEQ